MVLRLLCLMVFGWCAHATAPVHVAVGQIVEHPALDRLREGLQAGLAAQGYKVGDTFVWSYENAQGNPGTAVQIGHKLVSLQPTVIVTLSTPMTQAVAAATSSIPIVFGAVTDPHAAKLSHHSNITGLTDKVPSEQQIELVRKFLPQLKNLGVIYNAGEANSRQQVENLKRTAEGLGIIIVEATVSKTSEVSSAMKSLVGRVDAIILPTDNTVISALEALVRICTQYKIPVFGSDVDIVRRGAVAAYGVDWHTSGLRLADIVVPLLKGKPVPPIQNPEGLLFHINAAAAKTMGVSVPDDVAKKADKVL